MKNFNKKLEKFKANSKNPFSVPKGYFDDFPSRMQDRIISEQKEYIWVIRLFRYVKPQFALAFMIITFAVIAYGTVNFILSNRTTNGIDNELYTRIMEVDPTEFSEQHFLEVLFEEERKVNDHKNDEMEFYIHYLVDEDIDYGTLIDEL
ncbi:MAG: hypothetical protein C0597_16450 [Marinilabiliales bacterium]|nr:MAG: hypothetical protein C0597_16450 [Marinilabiliales bacterium]